MNRRAWYIVIGVVVLVAVAVAYQFDRPQPVAPEGPVGVVVAQSATFTFEGAAVGALPAEFESLLTGGGPEGRWEVVEDATAEGGKALAQLSDDQTNNRFPMAVHSTYSASELEVSTRFKAISGSVDQAGGVVLRLIDANNYYIARANGLEPNVRFYRVVNGQRQELASAEAQVIAGEWHSLAVRAEGNQFTVVFDGVEVISTTDDTFPSAGKVGFWTKADSVTHFESLQVAPPT